MDDGKLKQSLDFKNHSLSYLLKKIKICHIPCNLPLFQPESFLSCSIFNDRMYELFISLCMCFHNSMNKKIKDLAARYGRKSDVIEMAREILEEQYHVNAFHYPFCPIITGGEEIEAFQWGLIPFWTRTEEDAKEMRRMTLNAKAETLFQKPSFRGPAKTKRCLIPSTGYFEWRHEEKAKLPYYLFLKEEAIFSIAGVYEEWEDKKTGQQLFTFSMITTGANSLTAYIHNTKKRMPAILLKEEEENWLDPELSEKEALALLQPIPADTMEAYRIKNDFLRKPSTDPSVLEKAS